MTKVLRAYGAFILMSVRQRSYDSCMRQEACTPGGHCPSGILESPQCLARRSSSLRGTKGPRIRPFPLGWGTVAFGYSGTKTPALWQAGGHHRGLHAGRLRLKPRFPPPLLIGTGVTEATSRQQARGLRPRSSDEPGAGWGTRPRHGAPRGSIS